MVERVFGILPQAPATIWAQDLTPMSKCAQLRPLLSPFDPRRPPSRLPFLLKRCGVDPATSSAPFVATLVDVTGLVIYFTVAMVILHGTLL